MGPNDATFHETALGGVPLKDLGLTIAGTRLQPIVDELLRELERAGLRRIHPRFYLSTEWGVPFDTIAVAIPFYLARTDLTEIHARRTGHVEGMSRADILRYLRHELGHVVNYAYRLYEQREWVELFGSITQPYLEEYRPSPFSRRHVSHLPGWYAQKHPDEDWAETFAVWLTPGRDWRVEYAPFPEAMAKLAYCERTMAALRDLDPIVTDDALDEDVGELGYSLDEFYGSDVHGGTELPRGLDGALRAIFEDLGAGEDAPEAASAIPAGRLLVALERELLANVYRWTGHFPEATRLLLRHLAGRADELGLVYPEIREREASLALTTLVTALAMNHVFQGSYLP